MSSSLTPVDTLSYQVFFFHSQKYLFCLILGKDCNMTHRLFKKKKAHKQQWRQLFESVCKCVKVKKIICFWKEAKGSTTGETEGEFCKCVQVGENCHSKTCVLYLPDILETGTFTVAGHNELEQHLAQLGILAIMRQNLSAKYYRS